MKKSHLYRNVIVTEFFFLLGSSKVSFICLDAIYTEFTIKVTELHIHFWALVWMYIQLQFIKFRLKQIYKRKICMYTYLNVCWDWLWNHLIVINNIAGVDMSNNATLNLWMFFIYLLYQWPREAHQDIPCHVPGNFLFILSVGNLITKQKLISWILAMETSLSYVQKMLLQFIITSSN